MEQKQQQGDRRQSQAQYPGNNPVEHDPIFDETTITPVTQTGPGATPDGKDEQPK